MFIKEGAVMKTRPDFTDPSEKYLFLCSDVLVIAQVCQLASCMVYSGGQREGRGT